MPQWTLSRFQVCMLNLDAVYIHPATIWFCNHICHQGVLVPRANDNTLCVLHTKLLDGNSVIVNSKCKRKNTSGKLTVLFWSWPRWLRLLSDNLPSQTAFIMRGKQKTYEMCMTWVQGLTVVQCSRAKQHRNRLQKNERARVVAPQCLACWNNGLRCSKYWLC